jgi:hypothetical protein
MLIELSDNDRKNIGILIDLAWSTGNVKSPAEAAELVVLKKKIVPPAPVGAQAAPAPKEKKK